MSDAKPSQTASAPDQVEGSLPAMTLSGYPIRIALYALVAIPVFVLILVLMNDTYRLYRARIDEAYHIAANMRAMSGVHTESFVAQTKSALSQLAQRPEVLALDAERCDRELAALKRHQPAYANVLVLDKTGSLVCSATPLPGGRASAPDPKYYFSELVRTGQFTIGKPAQGFITGRWVSTFAYPLTDAAGSFIGAVAIAVDLVNFEPLFSEKSVAPGTVIGIVNSDGVIIARSQDSEQRVGKFANLQALKVVLEKREGSLRFSDHQGRQRLYSFGPIADSDWFTYVSLDEEEVIRPVIQLAWMRLGLIVGLLFALMTLTSAVARRIARPVEKISETMALVGVGNVHARATPKGPREVRHIATQLNAMLDARVLADTALRQSEERFRTAFRTSPDALSITRLSDGEFLEINDGYTAMTGWDRAEIIGKTIREISVWRYPEERFKLTQPLQHGGVCHNLETEFITREGRIFTGLLSASVMMLGGSPCVLSIIRDISATKSAAEKIHNLSFSDPLTGLPNRRLFIDRLELALISGTQLQHGAVLCVDIDNFKSINDSLGHDQGDLFLAEVARRLITIVRHGDTVARLGDDEFVILMEGLSANAAEAAHGAETLGEKIVAALGLPYLLGGASHHRTCSIGITLLGTDSQELVEPLERAELAMLRAKEAGPNNICFFDAKIQAAVSARAAMEKALRDAIAQGQIFVHYQPQVTKHGRITGVEALARWCDPCWGIVSPAEFIPLAEASGLIIPLGQSVLESACRQLATWSGQPQLEHLSIAVNVSTRQFSQDDFVQQVLAVLERTGANPLRLKLEMTESLLVVNVEQVIAKMNALKDVGIGFSLDDFGTGYSSLSYLKRLPLDQLKIDIGFVRDILIDPNDAAIARMVVVLAASMGLSVIAEGVETEAQRAKLADLGCPNYQGYLFGRPMPVAELEILMKRSAAAAMDESVSQA